LSPRQPCNGDDWQERQFGGATDQELLLEAREKKQTLVAYDQSTIALRLKSGAEQDLHHAGVVFIDDLTIPPSDFGGIAKALAVLWKKEHSADWKDGVVYLTRSRA
jgi:hypothetical protein